MKKTKFWSEDELRDKHQIDIDKIIADYELTQKPSYGANNGSSGGIGDANHIGKQPSFSNPSGREKYAGQGNEKISGDVSNNKQKYSQLAQQNEFGSPTINSLIDADKLRNSVHEGETELARRNKAEHSGGRGYSEEELSKYKDYSDEDIEDNLMFARYKLVMAKQNGADNVELGKIQREIDNLKDIQRRNTLRNLYGIEGSNDSYVDEDVASGFNKHLSKFMPK